MFPSCSSRPPRRVPRRGVPLAALVTLVAAITGCGRPAAPLAAVAPPSPAATSSAPAAAPRVVPLGLADAPPAAAAGSAAPPSLAAALPAGVEVGVRTPVAVPGDQDVVVYSGPADRRRAFVYLHGVCGDPGAVESWVHVVTARGTLVVLRGESPCASRPGRSSWKAPATTIAARIERALAAVRAHRGGLLDSNEAVLIGYSQGAARAEQLARLRPDAFPRVVLASGPTPPEPEALAGAAAVAVLAGSKEYQAPLEIGVAALCEAGLRARFFSLPGAAHGEYGHEGARVVDQVLAWLLEEGSPGGD